MQTLEFTRALREIVKELKVNELTTLLKAWLPVNLPAVNLGENDKDKFQDLVSASHSGNDWLMRNETYQQILGGLSTQQLYEPARLRRMAVAVSNSTNSAQVRAPDLYSFFEALMAIQRLEQTCSQLLEAPKIGNVPPDYGVVAIELTDYLEDGISAERLKNVVVLLIKLHANLARIHGITNDKLTITYLDSGSLFTLALKAAKPIMESFGTFMREYWDKIRFARFETYNKKMEVLSQGLTIMTTIKKSEETNVITAEVARNMTRRVLKEMDDLVGLGATVPLQKGTIIDEQVLLSGLRSTKLLESGTPPDEEDIDEDVSSTPPSSQ